MTGLPKIPYLLPNKHPFTTLIIYKTHEKQLYGGVISSIKTTLSNPKQPSCKKVCSPKNAIVKKRCEIQDGGQEMAVMVG